jgi:hypothetical protein
VLEKAYEFGIDLHLLFIDFKQAYDTVDRKYLFEILKEFGIPKKLVNLIKMTLIDSNCRVKIQGQLSSIFKVKVGLRQGEALSTILFNIVLEKAIRNIEINLNGTIFNRTKQYLAYADVVILGRSVRAIEEVLAQLKNTALKAGLAINESKTKCMRTTRNEMGDKSDLRAEGMVFEEVTNFKYLGSLITRKNEIGEEIKMRIAAGNRCYYGLLHLFGPRTMSRRVKIKIYKTILKPIVIFGCEAWSMTEKVKTRLNMWERKILRKVYGPVTEQGVWIIRTNEELRELYKARDLVVDIKRKRLEWLGHVIRMDQRRVVKKIFDSKPEGRRKVDRPRLRWLDELEDDLRVMKVKRWRKKSSKQRRMGICH